MWEYDNQRSFTRVVLEPGGICTLVMGGTIEGGLREGIGGRCRYSEIDHTISITHLSEIDGSGPSEKIPEPFVMNYDTDTDTIVMSADKPIRLIRITKW